MKINRMYTGFKDASWHLNPLQEQFLPFTKELGCNIIVAAPTASGKTTAICMRGYPTLKRGFKIVYFAIMRALADEKYEEFSSPDHPWASKYNFACVTGDVAWTPSQFLALERADVVCITPESFLSIIKSGDERKIKWLKKVRLIACDEDHLVGQEGRGAAYETAIAEASRMCPKAKLLGLSATVPNAQDFVQWFTNLNGKETKLVYSDYRSVPVERTYYSYDSEADRLRIIKSIQEKFEGQQKMYCVWSKAFGNKIIDMFREKGTWAEFHSANQDKASRKRIEAAFKARQLKDLVSTSTLTTGVNLPATHVITTAAEAGGKPIPFYELMQAMGRTGRPGYDKIGYQHVMLPEADFDYHVNRLEKGEPIISTMVDPAALAQHFVQAVYKGVITSREEFDSWFERTLAYVQLCHSKNHLVSVVTERCLDHMVENRMVYFEEETGKINIRSRGRICAQLMLDPYDFSTMLRNFNRAAAKGRLTMAEFISAYTYVPSHEGSGIDKRVQNTIQNDYPEAYDYAATISSAYKAVALALSMRMTGKRNPQALMSIDFQIMDNVNRYGEGVLRAAKEGKEFTIDEDKFSAMVYQAKYGVDSRTALINVGSLSSAERRGLMKYGLRSINDLRKNPHLIKEVVGTIKRAKELRLVN